jgi:polyketide synthase Type III
MYKAIFTGFELGPSEGVANSRPIQGPVVSGFGSAFPDRRYTQAESAQLLGIKNPTVQKLLSATHIKTRHLYLPEPSVPGGAIHDETHEELIAKFEAGVRDIGVKAVSRAIEASSLRKHEIDFLVCVTSSGFSVPGVSSIIARELGLADHLYRLDVVGMGCNAGMSGLRTATALAAGGARGVLLCCEINSAIYVRNESVRTGIVNSLFGDGAAAIVLNGPSASSRSEKTGKVTAVFPEILGFESFTLPDQWDAMRFDWDKEQKKWSFGLSKKIPFVVGDNLQHPVHRLLLRHGLSPRQIKHWSIHTGGAAVIDGAKKSLGLSEEDVRHTRSVLRDYGNISSGSFLVSVERLLRENSVQDGDFGVWAAMGPGATLEAGLIRYQRLS